MKTKDKIDGDVGILWLKGKIMGYPETDDLHNEVKSLLGGGAKKIVIDLQGVNWMNSMGVGALMRSLTTVRNAGGELCLSRLTEKVRSIFVMTQLVRVFEIYESVDKAVEHYKSS
ncbi:MAG: STAS domain-containing protein [Calditrichaceae bacterium]